MHNFLAVELHAASCTLLDATSAVDWRSPKNPRFGKRCDAAIVIAERLAQHCLGMLAQQGRRHGVSDRRQAETDRRFDVGDGARGRVRDLADAMDAPRTSGELKASSTVRR